VTTIIAIDPSMTGTGLAVWTDGEVRLATIRTSKTDGPPPARWSMVLRALDEMAPLAYAEQCMVAMEEYPYELIKLGARGVPDRFGLRGVLLLRFWQVSIPVVEVNTKVIKLYAGAGKHDKGAMINAAEALGGPVRDHNQADAYVLLRMCLHAIGLPPALPYGEEQRETAVGSVDWPTVGQWSRRLE
jgi:hypothetical protein